MGLSCLRGLFFLAVSEGLMLAASELELDGHAVVWETRFSMNLVEQGQKQNGIELVFTLVTIDFYPCLSSPAFSTWASGFL